MFLVKLTSVPVALISSTTKPAPEPPLVVFESVVVIALVAPCVKTSSSVGTLTPPTAASWNSPALLFHCKKYPSVGLVTFTSFISSI